MSKKNLYDPGPTVELGQLEVTVRNGNFDEALKRFKMLVQADGILLEYKESLRYEKPSERQRRKKQESIQRRLIDEMKERQMASGEWEKKQKKKEQKRLKKTLERTKKNEHQENLDE